MTPNVSFELFPPRTAESEARLWVTLERLRALDPRFISVTCGGGAATADTLRALSNVIERTGIPVAGHLTCTGRSRAQTDAALGEYWRTGVRHLVAVRGDMPEVGTEFVAHPGGYRSALELIAAARSVAPFEITVAAYPESHPESRSVAADLELLARKAEAGASRAITQFCFDSRAIARLRDDADRAGIALKIVPGIMLTTNFRPVERMGRKCGATIPDWLTERFAGLDEDLEARRLTAAIIAARQLEELRREGFEDFHFYTLNQADVVPALCRSLNGDHTRLEAVVA